MFSPSVRTTESLLKMCACSTRKSCSHFNDTQCVWANGNVWERMCMSGWWLLLDFACTYTNQVAIYSPWRACGSWPVLRRNPPHWPSEGQRQKSCQCSRRAFACSCASWTASHTAPGHAWRSREEDRVKGKRRTASLKHRENKTRYTY